VAAHRPRATPTGETGSCLLTSHQAVATESILIEDNCPGGTGSGSLPNSFVDQRFGVLHLHLGDKVDLEDLRADQLALPCGHTQAFIYGDSHYPNLTDPLVG